MTLLSRLRHWLLPVRTLKPRHRSQVLAHLLALPERDRYLRFGYLASDDQVKTYVEHLDFRRDEVFGIFDRRLDLVAMAHLAYGPDPETGAAGASPKSHGGVAEFGVSVNGSLRGRGVGARLFEHAVLHARNRGIDTLVVHTLSENGPMIKLARRAGAVTERFGGDVDASLKAPRDTLGSHVGALVEDHLAEIDYQIKLHGRQIDSFLDTVDEVHQRLGHTHRVCSQ
jgi:GNAT superfamily N-acetyltransferase